MKFFPQKIRYFLGLFLAMLLAVSAWSQTIHGRVLERRADGQPEALVGANAYWLGTTTGAATDAEGRFSLNRVADRDQLVVSFTGYRADTLRVAPNADSLTVFLSAATQLDEVVVSGASVSIDRINPIQTELLTTRTLAKAACCNLSESFETNASVSVSYTDAVTGAKQIQLLGLSGSYVQSNVENIPSIRGLATTFGLNYIPGTWIKSIDLGKGAGSVVNGYEGMVGALNVELMKPEDSEKLYVNTYFNSFGRGELNVNAARKLSERWSVGLLSHASTLQTKIDKNGDGFLDLPLYTQLNGINRWKYAGERFMAQFGVKALYEDRLGGQTAFDPDRDKGRGVRYGFGNTTRRLEAFSKTAKLFPKTPYRGLGLILNAVDHDSRSYFGFNTYTGRQQSLYANLIYQDIFGNTNHQFKAGLSYLLDGYRERYNDSTFARTESVPGVFVEYTETIPEKLTVVLGLRSDVHNLFGTQWTPRLHLKYNLNRDLTLRASAGRGWRVPNVLAENLGLLINSRELVGPGRLSPEISWNYGASLAQEFRLGGRTGSLVLDFYRTDFTNQLLADMDTPGLIQFYYQPGKSYSNSFQAELNYQPAKRFDLKLAYRRFDVQADQRTEEGIVRLPRMFVNRDRVLFNVGYALPYDKWKVDVTWQWNGKRRIPHVEDTAGAHPSVLNPQLAPAFSNFNAQVSRAFRAWEVYLGGENLGNFTQKNPIVAANDPFGRRFDASMTWGPIVGRMIYLGTRYRIR
ncbi:MAG: TonB-dependent receptor [Sphingobacteriaceae bacterium]|nr:TonB-dependent receptor [Cytophagaceae bacterium]